MRTLSLLRHAKSSWEDERLADFDRPLAPRGLKAARRMGQHMRKIGLAPDLVLCSPAVRTRETAALALAELDRADLKIEYDGALYETEPEVLMARLAGIEDGIRHLLVIGHNPSLQELSLMLAGDARAPERAAIAEKLPTGALVVLELAIDGWADLRAGCGRIAHVMTPRKLETD
jgi:phosphohistidine phosphatase